MRHKWILFFLVCCFGMAGLAGEPNAVPKVPSNVILKPTFMTGHDSFSGGTAFVCSAPSGNGIFMLTAHHLFGSACGLEKEYNWQEVPKTYIAVTGLSMEDSRHYVTSVKPLVIPGAHALDKSGCDKDVAGYRLDGVATEATLKLSETLPKEGEVVFLYARQRGGERLEFFPATVTKADDAVLEFRFETNGMKLGGTSGAPVINKSGEVVAINIGGWEQEKGTYGFGNPCTSVIKMLKSATSD